MGNESVTIHPPTDEQITAEIAAYLEQPDYYAEGWRTTRQLAESKGIPMSKADKLLNKLAVAGTLEKMIDGSGRAWWRLLAVPKGD